MPARKKGESRRNSPPRGGQGGRGGDGGGRGGGGGRQGPSGGRGGGGGRQDPGGAHSNAKSQSFEMLNSLVSGFSKTVAAKFTSQLGGNNDKVDKEQRGTSAPGEFDLYLFAQSWAPRFCCSSASKCKKEGWSIYMLPFLPFSLFTLLTLLFLRLVVTPSGMEETDDLSTHGLWPAYNGPDKSGRTYPAFCKEDTTKGQNNRASHEWSKHGTCTVLSKDAYLLEEEKVSETESLGRLSDLLNSSAGEALSVSSIFDGMLLFIVPTLFVNLFLLFTLFLLCRSRGFE